MLATNEFNVWFNGAPILSVNGNYEFAVWIDGAPVLEQGQNANLNALRRRVLIF